MQIDYIPTLFPDPDNPNPTLAFNRAAVHLNNSLDSLSGMIRDERLINLAAERYYGALHFGNLAAANFQRNNVFDFVHQFNSDRDAFRNELKLASSLFNQQGYLNGVSATVADVISLRNQILASGKFPAEEEQVFSKLGVTDVERRAILNEVSLVNGDTLVGSDLQGPVILDRLADRFGQLDVTQLLPPDLVAGPVVPEPSSIVMFGTGAFTLLGYMWHCRRRSAA
jgi:PEP-CTERM motif